MSASFSTRVRKPSNPRLVSHRFFHRPGLFKHNRSPQVVFGHEEASFLYRLFFYSVSSTQISTMGLLATLNNALLRNGTTPVKFKIGGSSRRNSGFGFCVNEHIPAAENLFCRKRTVMVSNNNHLLNTCDNCFTFVSYKSFCRSGAESCQMQWMQTCKRLSKGKLQTCLYWLRCVFLDPASMILKLINDVTDLPKECVEAPSQN